MQQIELEPDSLYHNKGDLDAYIHIYDTNVILHGVPGEEPGIESARKFYQGFHKAFPGVQISVDDLITKADMLTCRFTVSGRHRRRIVYINRRISV